MPRIVALLLVLVALLPSGAAAQILAPPGCGGCPCTRRDDAPPAGPAMQRRDCCDVDDPQLGDAPLAVTSGRGEAVGPPSRPATISALPDATPAQRNARPIARVRGSPGRRHALTNRWLL